MYDVSDKALQALIDPGAERRGIPGGLPPYFEGDEVWVPVSAFKLFDELAKEGEIVVEGSAETS